MSKVEQQSPSATAVAQRNTRKSSRRDDLAEWGADIDEQITALHTAVLDVEGAIPPGIELEKAMGIIRARIASIHEATAHMRRGGTA